MYFTRLRFITHLDCLSRASLFGNSALSCIKMNACGCILLERGIYTCTLFACAVCGSISLGCPAAKKIAKLLSFANCHGSISL